MKVQTEARPSVPDYVIRWFQDSRREEVRLNAATEAASMLRMRRRWTEEDLQKLLRWLRTDWRNGKERYDRFSPGLVGHQANRLLEVIEPIDAWLGRVRVTASTSVTDDAAEALLTDFWSRPELSGTAVFPTAVLAALEPHRFIALTKPTAFALNKIYPGAQFSNRREAPEYLRICRAVRALCDPQRWPLCLADAALHIEPEPEAPVEGTKNSRGDELRATSPNPESLGDLSQRLSFSSEKLLEIEEALFAKGQIILSGPPGTSKTYLAAQFARYFVQELPGSRPQGNHRVLYMHSSWAYEDFFEGLRPKVGGSGLEFSHHRGAFFAWIEDEVQKGPKGARYLIVLDEINRCDTAAVLGELLQLMEYRGQSVTLLSGRTFQVPKSVFIIGTMNSADRSIGRMDLALRRRFLFVDLFPDPDVLQSWLETNTERNPCKLDAESLRECNAWLEREFQIPREQQLGHALFMPAAQNASGDDAPPLTGQGLRRIVKYSVAPYVRELLLERGRDPNASLRHLEAFFERYYGMAEDGVSSP